MSSAILATVAKRLPELDRLDTDLLYWNGDDMRLLFEACLTLTHLSVHELTGQAMKAIADLAALDRPGAKRLERFKCVHGRFEPAELVHFCAHFPNLIELSVPVQQFLSSKDLINIASHCTRIQVFNANFCLGLASAGFQAIFSANPGLTVLDLGMTEVTDQDIALVATHCPKLNKLMLPFCGNVTHHSIKQIVRHCDQLEYLDISWCDRVMLSIFENDGGEDDSQRQEPQNEEETSEDSKMMPAVDSAVQTDSQGSSLQSQRRPPRPCWKCTRLKHLDISGIHATYTEDTDSTPAAPSFLPAMYAQLAELSHLEFLNMSGLVFSLRLNPLALEAFANDRLSHLETLNINPMKERLPWSDLVAIGNLFLRLQDFRFKKRDISTEEIGVGLEKRGSDAAVPSRPPECAGPDAKTTQSGTPGPSGDSDTSTEGTGRTVEATLRSGLKISIKLRSSADGDESEEDEGALGMGFPFGIPQPFIGGGDDGDDPSQDQDHPSVIDDSRTTM
ncbi:hypothetical protein BGZ73_008045 [Actinomortierella ambigua]|nr:hypothetical protein BGZ73_008045 [Actinomortierella ambigua]